jgi:hypothetical protein
MNENLIWCGLLAYAVGGVCFIALGLQSGCKWLLARLRGIL